MSKAPLMPMATAVWLVENTTLTFKQIADYCRLHEVEVQGIADGEVAKGIIGYNPIMSGQLSREEIDLSSKDGSRPLQIKGADIEISNSEKKINPSDKTTGGEMEEKKSLPSLKSSKSNCKSQKKKSPGRPALAADLLCRRPGVVLL